MKLPRVFLGIETSCDETAAALLIDGQVAADRTTRQILHERYGGVVPELASRAHEQLLAPAVRSVLSEVGISPSDVDGIAVTYGPGLAGALLVGLSFAKGFSGAMGIPLWAVNHIEAHLWIARLSHGEIPLPALALIISGGHTIMVGVERFGEYRLLGTTRDDAVGELFDKVGRVIGFPFPAGARIDELAVDYSGKPVLFPVSRVKNDPYAFSFSGIKTAVLNFLQQNYPRDETGQFILPSGEKSAIAAGLMNAVAKTLATPLKLALSNGGFDSLIIAGGVSASRFLRKEFAETVRNSMTDLIIPPIHHCTDNGAMIAYTGYLMAVHGIAPSNYNVDVNPSARLWQARNS